ncbi:MAG: hypothetical protein JRM72_01770 [Nitrososphaerota archaeon]|nr:hypothetical protein [Nitrososphaerota archaeon]
MGNTQARQGLEGAAKEGDALTSIINSVRKIFARIHEDFTGTYKRFYSLLSFILAYAISVNTIVMYFFFMAYVSHGLTNASPIWSFVYGLIITDLMAFIFGKNTYEHIKYQY